MTEGIPCMEERRLRVRRIPADIDAAIGKRRSATPHWYEMEAIARRGF
ncbi:MAG TPA: hypothetical protein VMC61_00195 [Methanocella sp.]|nr:hypothetical protein [Methanocella sp.]